MSQDSNPSQDGNQTKRMVSLLDSINAQSFFSYINRDAKPKVSTHHLNIKNFRVNFCNIIWRRRRYIPLRPLQSFVGSEYPSRFKLWFRHIRPISSLRMPKDVLWSADKLSVIIVQYSNQGSAPLAELSWLSWAELSFFSAELSQFFLNLNLAHLSHFFKTPT